MSDIEDRALDVLRERLVNEVAGHMPASGECNELLISQSVRWGFDRVIRDVVAAPEPGSEGSAAAWPPMETSAEWYKAPPADGSGAAPEPWTEEHSA